MSSDQSDFDLGDGGGQKPYVVLARKYRPETFDDLIGQEAMVTTLTNAFASDRIAQGYMLTGVRGVGKTTTARILARALNYSKPGLPDRPTVQLDGYGEHCAEIIASRHPDVIEMDAASNTGVDNIREIIESARYRPLTARYKVYIIDEVHMLSKGAFNALLKTLEEPPEHVKFIFATTEVRKVPVTVLSRCQRFDLRRVEVGALTAHFQRIVEAEGATAEPDALMVIARAAEGSVRDGLSILDQAIAMGAGKVTASGVRSMLGLADRGRIFDLLELLLSGDAKGALEAFAALHRDGGDPQQVMVDLADAVHAVTRAKTAGADAAGEGLSGEERKRAGRIAEEASIALLSRYWQMLVKGLEEAGKAPDAKAAAEMVLIRIAFTADLPSPDDLVRMLGGESRRSSSTGPAAPSGESGRAGRPEAAGASAEESHGATLQSFEEVVALAGERRDVKLKIALEDHVGLVSFVPGRIEINLMEGAPQGLAGELGEKLTRWTGERWIVTVSREAGAMPIGEVRRRAQAAELAAVTEDPAVAALLAGFPGAEIRGVRDLALNSTPASVDGEDDDESGTGTG